MSTAFGRPEGVAEEVNLMWTQVYVGVSKSWFCCGCYKWMIP